MRILRHNRLSRLVAAVILTSAAAISAVGISSRAALAYSPSGDTATGKTTAEVAQDCNDPQAYPGPSFPGQQTEYFYYPICQETGVASGTAITTAVNEPEDPDTSAPVYACSPGSTATSGSSHAVTTGSSWSVGGGVFGGPAQALFGLISAQLSASFNWSQTYSVTDTSSETASAPYGSMAWLEASKTVGVAEFTMRATYADGTMGNFQMWADQPDPNAPASFNVMNRVMSDDEFDQRCQNSPPNLSGLPSLSPTSGAWYPSDGRIVNSVMNDMCLDDTNWSTQPGTQLQVWQCGSGQQANQRWTWTSVGPSEYVIKNDNSGLCLDDLYSSSAAGNPIDEYTCNGTAAQDWYYEPQIGTVAPDAADQRVYQLVNVATNNCAIPSGSTNGSLMVLGDCFSQIGVGQPDIFASADGSILPSTFYTLGAAITPSTKFSVGSGASTRTGPLVNFGSGKCLDDTNWSTSAWTQMQIWQCTGGANQQWTLQSSGVVQNNFSALCLDVSGNDSTDFTPAIQYGCSSSDQAQVFTWKWTSFSGEPDGYEIVNDHGDCLDVDAAGTSNGATVDWYPCNHTGAQDWYLG